MRIVQVNEWMNESEHSEWSRQISIVFIEVLYEIDKQTISNIFAGK